MKVYLDNSFMNRPFDNFDVKLNRLEAEILFLIIDRALEGKLVLINSAVIEYENSLNPFSERKIYITEIMQIAKEYQNLTEKIRKEAERIVNTMNIQGIDALHLATAQVARVDFFITCDYNLVKRYKGTLKVIAPLDFLNYYENSTN